MVMLIIHIFSFSWTQQLKISTVLLKELVLQDIYALDYRAYIFLNLLLVFFRILVFYLIWVDQFLAQVY